MRYPAHFGIFYDFRNPPRWQTSWPDRYRQLLEQITWIDDALPFDEISLSEHHFVNDGWSPSTMALAAAVAVRTSRVGILTNILQLPIHHPLRVAEDALTVDILSAGRFRLGVSVGYREQEFASFGVPLRERATRMDEALAILRRAFAGETFSFAGVHWTLPELTVTPGPVRPGGPPIWIGGLAPAALERAAAKGDGFLASGSSDVGGYLSARRALGFHDDPPKVVRTTRMVVAEDPERALHDLGPNLVYQVNQYIDYGFIDRPHYDDPKDLVRDGVSQIADAQGALAALRQAAAEGVEEVHFFAVVPGEPVESGSKRLQYLADHVIRAVSESRKGVGTC